jgi:hypothetical protein
MSNKLTIIRNNTFSGVGYGKGKLDLQSNDISYLSRQSGIVEAAIEVTFPKISK